MKICIIYFSGTGVTAELALAISEGFRKSGHTVDLFRYKKNNSPPDIRAYDLIGFGTPAYSFFVPRIFLRFIKRIQGPKGMKYFIFVTSHSAPGITAQAIDRVCGKKGWMRIGDLLEGTGINNIRAWRQKTGSPKPLDILTVHGDVGTWVSAAVKNIGTAGDSTGALHESCRSLPGRPVLRIFSWLFTYGWQMALVEGLKKKVDREKCTKCRLCADVICPSGAITLQDDGFPRIRYIGCAGCSGCVNLCPAGAIYTDKGRERWAFDGMKEHILNG